MGYAVRWMGWPAWKIPGGDASGTGTTVPAGAGCLFVFYGIIVGVCRLSYGNFVIRSGLGRPVPAVYSAGQRQFSRLFHGVVQVAFYCVTPIDPSRRVQRVACVGARCQASADRHLLGRLEEPLQR